MPTLVASLVRIRTVLTNSVARMRATLTRFGWWLADLSFRVRTFAAVTTSESGQGLVEYGITIVFIAMVVAAVLTILGPQVGSMFSELTTQFPK